MNCLKGCCPPNAEYVCILAEFVKCLRVSVHARVRVCTVCFLGLHLTSFESDVGGGKRHSELVCSQLETF